MGAPRSPALALASMRRLCSSSADAKSKLPTIRAIVSIRLSMSRCWETSVKWVPPRHARRCLWVLPWYAMNELACPQGLEMKGERFGTSTKISKKKEPKAEELGFKRPRGQFPLIVPTQQGVHVGPVCFPWSGALAVLSRSSRAGVLPMVRRARSAFAKQSSGCAYHGQACVQCYNEAVGRVSLPWSRVRAATGRSRRAGVLCRVLAKKVHAVERGFWSAGKNKSAIESCHIHDKSSLMVFVSTILISVSTSVMPIACATRRP